MIDFTSTNDGYSVGYFRAMKFKVSTVTFQAKMNIKMREGGFQPGSGDVVQVKGSINDWGGNDVMTDADGDSTYSVTLPIGSRRHRVQVLQDTAQRSGLGRRCQPCIHGGRRCSDHSGGVF